MRPWRTTLLLTIFLLGLVGCAADNPYAFLPQPYRPADKGKSRMDTYVLADHIVVERVHGLDDESAERLASAVIASFLETGRIATASRPKARTSRLVGMVEGAEEAAGSGGTQTLRFVLIDPYGVRSAPVTFPMTAEEDIPSLSRRIANAFAPDGTRARVEDEALQRRQLAPPPVSEPGAPTFGTTQSPQGLSTQQVVVSAIFGASAEGAQMLRSAVRSALRDQGVRVVDRPGETVLQLQATVGLSESSRDGFERLSLSWELKSPKGKTLASIDQANDIPKGYLESGWQELAGPISYGAASGISDYLAKHAAAEGVPAE